jgi:hypothetical protein
MTCVTDHRWHVEAQVETLLATADEDTPLSISDPVTSQKKYNIWN